MWNRLLNQNLKLDYIKQTSNSLYLRMLYRSRKQSLSMSLIRLPILLPINDINEKWSDSAIYKNKFRSWCRFLFTDPDKEDLDKACFWSTSHYRWLLKLSLFCSQMTREWTPRFFKSLIPFSGTIYLPTAARYCRVNIAQTQRMFVTFVTLWDVTSYFESEKSSDFCHSSINMHATARVGECMSRRTAGCWIQRVSFTLKCTRANSDNSS